MGSSATHIRAGIFIGTRIYSDASHHGVTWAKVLIWIGSIKNVWSSKKWAMS